MEKKLWYVAFSRDDVPAFPCPRCKKPTLELDKDTLTIKEPVYSKQGRSHPEWEPDFVTETFIAMLRCRRAECGEIVTLAGEISPEPGYDEDGDLSYEGMLKPRAIYPAPEMISLPRNIPRAVRAELHLAFQLYWADFGACATKLRTSVERLMDHFKVVKYQVVKDPRKPTKRGKLRPYDLSVRIDKFIAATGNVVHQDLLHALRVVGNVGTHRNELDRDEILDAFEVYEHVLSELLDKKSAQITKVARKLRESAGRRKKDVFF
jgi:Domain of unknown function (DUF4145)